MFFKFPDFTIFDDIRIDFLLRLKASFFLLVKSNKMMFFNHFFINFVI